MAVSIVSYHGPSRLINKACHACGCEYNDDTPLGDCDCCQGKLLGGKMSAGNALTGERATGAPGGPRGNVVLKPREEWRTEPDHFAKI